jgi:nitroreductase
MKKTISVLLSFFIFTLFAAANENEAIKPIINHYAARSFLSTPVSQAEIDLLVRAAVNTPSARNLQPWHFTVVQNADLARLVIPGTTYGNVLFVISARGDGKTNHVEILDCALAAQSIYLAAQALGLGSRIYTGPVDAVNKDLKSALSLPSGHSVVAVVRVGKVQPVDAVSAASARKSASDVVTYKK